MARASASVVAIGFSHSTGTPAAAAASTSGRCASLGEATYTASIAAKKAPGRHRGRGGEQAAARASEAADTSCSAARVPLADATMAGAT